MTPTQQGTISQQLNRIPLLLACKQNSMPRPLRFLEFFKFQFDAVLSFLPRRINFRVAWRELHEFAGMMQLCLYRWAECLRVFHREI
jgi:hypothetical protein